MKFLRILFFVILVVFFVGVGYFIEVKNSDNLTPIVLKSNITGKITEINFEDNSKVKKGQIIAKIGAEDLKEKLCLIEDDISAAQKKLKLTDDEILKMREQYKKINLEIEKAKLKLDIANS
ncbi:biotin/lipoyl-binding protein, partial [bacterium]|nr:biotin/lipoyl-binding protein [bacterium]